MEQKCITAGKSLERNTSNQGEPQADLCAKFDKADGCTGNENDVSTLFFLNTRILYL